MALTQISSQKSFGGYQNVYSHESKSTQGKMTFAAFLPATIEKEKAPVLYWLSGLTCTHENFMQKSGFQRYAAQHGIVVVLPDTSPRGCCIEGENDSWDFGSGAGFYVNATEEKWKKHYNMYSYITQELPSLIDTNLNVDSGRQSITGHSMGGHGALTCTLNNPGMYQSVSAFAPICNPIDCPWGRKAFTGYLGTDTATWKQYDATELVKSYNGPLSQILIDQGSADKFLLEKQLLPEKFIEACRGTGIAVVLRMQDGYDHSYYFVSTFLEDHFNHHAQFLKN